MIVSNGLGASGAISSAFLLDFEGVARSPFASDFADVALVVDDLLFIVQLIAYSLLLSLVYEKKVTF